MKHRIPALAAVHFLPAVRNGDTGADTAGHAEDTDTAAVLHADGRAGGHPAVRAARPLPVGLYPSAYLPAATAALRGITPRMRAMTWTALQRLTMRHPCLMTLRIKSIMLSNRRVGAGSRLLRLSI